MKITIDAVPDGNGKIVSAGFEVTGIQTKKDADVAMNHLHELTQKLNLEENDESQNDQ